MEIKDRALDVVCVGPQSSPPPPLKAQQIRWTSDGEPVPARRDAATLTETPRTRLRITGGGVLGRDKRQGRRWELHRVKELLERWDKRTRGHRSRGVEYSSEEEPDTEEEEAVQRGRRDTDSPEPDQSVLQHRADRETGETELPVIHQQDNTDWIRPSGPNMTLQPADIKRTIGRSTNTDKAEFATGLMIGAVEETASSQLRKDRYRLELQEQMAEQQRNRKKEKDLELRVAATGAVDPEKQPDRIKQFGAVNREYESWRRDVPYRPGKGVDALDMTPRPKPREGKPPEETVTRDPPEKPPVALPPPWPDLRASLGALTGRSGLGIGTGVGVPGLTSFNEDFHRSLSNTLGEMAAPRLASIPPPVAPTVADSYKTPYDEAYYYYGTRNPLDLNLPYYPVHLGGQQQQQHVVLPILPQGPPAGPGGRHGATNQRAAPSLDIGALPGEKPRSTREGVLKYQEELRQQIKEREDRKRREKEEQERYDAKMEAEMKAHDPWGRSGGGAPIKDRGGNLISDLKQMHRTNREAYMNPESGDRREAQGSDRADLPTSQGQAKLPQFARGNPFTDQPTPQHLREQDSYREFLKRQIEEKRQKEVEEQEHVKREEEREERRLVEQRARMQQEYEMERNRGNKKNTEQATLNRGLTHEFHMQRPNTETYMNSDPRGGTNSPQLDPGKAFTDQPSPQQLRDQSSYRDFLKQQIEEKRQKGMEERERISKEEEREERRLAEQRARIQQEYERERGSSTRKNNERQPSPHVPTLQKRLGPQQTSRPSTVASQLSSRSVAAQERSLSAPHSPPVPARRNQLRAKESQRGVIRELSALRRHLRSEQRRLAGQLGQADKTGGADTPVLTRRRPRLKVATSDMAWLDAVQAVARRPHSGAPRVNMQNIREFNQLKYRDTVSREEVLHMYPDPPSDEHSLDLQQQALLQEQQRGARSRRRREEEDRHELQLNYARPRAAHAHQEQRASLLASESAFIDCGDPGQSLELADRQRSPQTSPVGRERKGPPRRREYQEEGVSLAGQRDFEFHPDTQSLGSLASLNVEQVMARNLHRIRRLDQLNDDHHDRAGGDEEDVFSLRSTPDAPRRRVSVETVATEPWLRPGTSEGARRQSWRERPGVQDTTETEWEGPSTNHG